MPGLVGFYGAKPSRIPAPRQCRNSPAHSRDCEWPPGCYLIVLERTRNSQKHEHETEPANQSERELLGGHDFFAPDQAGWLRPARLDQGESTDEGVGRLCPESRLRTKPSATVVCDGIV